MRIYQKKVSRSLPLISDLHPVLQRVYALRNIQSKQQLDNSLQGLLPFSNLKDIDKACERLEKALRNNENILIVGDFDADGATSTALVVSALRLFGVVNVSYLVPNRFEYGYGLTPAIVEVASKRSPGLIITVDNGIASIDGVNKAKQLGIDVIITDHHLPAEELPLADAIVNPNQIDCQFISKSIAGVGVSFYLMLALRRHLDNVNWFREKNLIMPNMGQLLDLVALGTVADVVALDHNNRILVSQGISRMRRGLIRPGILALLEVAKRNVKTVQASCLGFSVAPRLNAAGRLDDMSLGIECLLCDDLGMARDIAQQLDDLNVERRKIEAEMKEQANNLLSNLVISAEQELPIALCLFDSSWHQGVIGILAGRLKDSYNRPTIIFSEVGENELKGSARSISGLNIRDVLAYIDKDNPGLINKFGGHAMAAGLSIEKSKFLEFNHVFVDAVSKHIDLENCSGDLYSDGSLSAMDFNLELALLLQEGGPWGASFPEPKFDNVFEILDQRIVGQNHLKMTLIHPEGDTPIDAIMFNVDLKVWPNQRNSYIHALYKLDINYYKGNQKLQLIIEDMLVHEMVNGASYA